MVDLEALENEYRDAQEAFSEDRSDENKEAYREAKKAFADARVEQRQSEELDPDHPRGKSVAQVSNEEGDK